MSLLSVWAIKSRSVDSLAVAGAAMMNRFGEEFTCSDGCVSSKGEKSFFFPFKVECELKIHEKRCVSHFFTVLSAALISRVGCCQAPPRLLPAGAKGTLGSSSDRSALIRLLSDDGRHCVRAGRLSTLPPLDSGRVLNGSPCTSKRKWDQELKQQKHIAASIKKNKKNKKQVSVPRFYVKTKKRIILF